MDKYYTAQTCRRAHVETWAYTEPDTSGWQPPGLDEPPAPSMCSVCGEPLITACPSCGSRIRGWEKGRSSVYYTPTLSDFCDGCGAPMPWASRQARIYQLENLLDGDAGVDEATKLKARDELRALAEDPTEDAAVETERWLRLRQFWPKLSSAAMTIFISVATAEAKQKLGLPP